jgi:hypothetical protein
LKGQILPKLHTHDLDSSFDSFTDELFDSSSRSDDMADLQLEYEFPMNSAARDNAVAARKWGTRPQGVRHRRVRNEARERSMSFDKGEWSRHAPIVQPGRLPHQRVQLPRDPNGFFCDGKARLPVSSDLSIPLPPDQMRMRAGGAFAETELSGSIRRQALADRVRGAMDEGRAPEPVPPSLRKRFELPDSGGNKPDFAEGIVRPGNFPHQRKH